MRKGIGPRGLGVSPLKQTKRQSIMQNEDGSLYTKEQETKENVERLTKNIQDVPNEGPSQGSGAIGLIGGAAAKGLAAIGREVLKRGTGPSKTGNVLIKTAQKILKKTNPKPKHNPHLRADAYGNSTFDARSRTFYGQKPGSN